MANGNKTDDDGEKNVQTKRCVGRSRKKRRYQSDQYKQNDENHKNPVNVAPVLKRLHTVLVSTSMRNVAFCHDAFVVEKVNDEKIHLTETRCQNKLVETSTVQKQFEKVSHSLTLEVNEASVGGGRPTIGVLSDTMPIPREVLKHSHFI